jgi:hypothetical protein
LASRDRFRGLKRQPAVSVQVMPGARNASDARRKKIAAQAIALDRGGLPRQDRHEGDGERSRRRCRLDADLMAT